MEFPDFESVVMRSKVLMEDRHGLKVIETPEGEIMKLFRRKRLFSSALLDPYAKRFARNARRLAERGIPTVEVRGVFRVSRRKRDVVVYRRLEGALLREVEGRERELAGFLAELHGKGVLFRSIHLGNIVAMPDGRLGLIDIADMKCRRRSLTVKERVRNFGHLVKYGEDRERLRRFGFERFLDEYLKASEREREEDGLRAMALEKLAGAAG